MSMKTRFLPQAPPKKSTAKMTDVFDLDYDRKCYLAAGMLLYMNESKDMRVEIG